MADEKKALSVKDIETVSDAILQLVQSYRNYPATITKKNILWQNVVESECIGLFTMTGAIYNKRYVSGSYEAQLPFRIVYRCTASANNSRIGKQNVIDNLAKWLELCDFPSFKDNKLSIQKIERTSLSYKTTASGNGYEEYTCTMNLKYFYKN